MVSGIIVLLLFLVLGGSKSQRCENTMYKSSVGNECYSSFNKCNSSGCNSKPNVTYEMDAVNGIVVAHFTLPPPHCCYTRYEVELLVNEKLNESTCVEDARILGKHSVRDYYVKQCENGSCPGDVCDQYGKVVFNYVYSSCYKLWIRPYIGSNSQASVFSFAHYIETNFTKVKIADLIPRVGHVYRSKEKRYTLEVSYPQPISQSAIEFNFCENGSRVNGAVVSLKAGIDGNGSTCVPLATVMGPKCEYEIKDINCTFYNVTPGNYCIRVTIDDDRCLPGTVWTTNNSCRWSRTLGIPEQVPDKPDVSVFSVSSIAIGIIIIIIGVLLLLMLGFWLFRRSRFYRNSTLSEPPDDVIRPMMLKMKVLLLYPRDCKEFMDVMDSFRRILEKFHNIEVFDCYNTEDVLNGPLSWLQSLMSKPRLYTIVVTSQCAHIQLKAMKSGNSIAGYSLYKEPTFLDSLFIYGLKLIMEDISPDIYHKNYIIGFNGFSECTDTLTLPTSFRRYIIPNHLKKLLSDMNVENFDENLNLLHSSEYISLLTNIRSLVDYKTKNPQYLEELLNLA